MIFLTLTTYIPKSKVVFGDPFSIKENLELKNEFDYIISTDKNLSKILPGVKIATFENDNEKMLFVPKGNLQDKLKKEKRIFIENFYQELPREEMNFRIKVNKVINGKNAKLGLNLCHLGFKNPWVNERSLGEFRYSVFLGVLIFENDEVIIDHKMDFLKIVYPQECIDVKIPIKEVLGSDVLKDGEYRLKISPIQADVEWFFEEGYKPLDLKMDINNNKVLING